MRSRNGYALKRRSGSRMTLRAALLPFGIAACAMVVVATAAASAMYSNAATPSAAAQSGSLTYARADEPSKFDPQGVPDLATAQVLIQLYDQLVELLPGSDVPQPGLAKSWRITDGGRTYTFTLREARFSNGDRVTVDDVVFSLNRARSPKTDPGFSFLFDTIRSVSVRRPSTVAVRLSKPTPALLGYLSAPPGSIIPKAYFSQVGPKGFDKAPIGSGPFQLDEFTRGQRLVLKRNPYYWRRGKPVLDEVVQLYIPDDNARVLALRSGRVDAADGIPYAQLKSIESANNLRLLTKVAGIIDAIYFNQSGSPLRETKVRQALNHATPLRSINRVVFAGKAQVANSLIPRLRFWDPRVKPYDYSIPKAKKLFGSTPGFSVSLMIVGTDTASRQIAQIVQSSWGKLGVRVSVRAVDTATWFAELIKGNYQASLIPSGAGNSDVAEPDELLNLFWVADVLHMNHENTQVPALVKEASVTQDMSKRGRLLKRIQRLGLRDPYGVPIAFEPARMAMRRGVSGFDVVTPGWWRLETVRAGR